MTRKTASTIALALALLPAGVARAQSISTPLDHRISGRIELWHPHLKEDAEGSLSATSGPLYFSVGFPVNETVALSFELPYARASVSDDPLFGDYDDNTVGNPYLGVQLGSLKKPVSFVGELGLRFSAVNEDSFLSYALAAIADPERMEAFVPKTNTLSAAGNIVMRQATSSTRLRLGVTQLLSDDQDGIGNHTLIDYGAQASLDVDKLRFGGTLSGRYAADGDGSFGERSNHFALGTASMALGFFRPSLNVRLPFDSDARDVVPWTVGIGVEYTFH